MLETITSSIEYETALVAALAYAESKPHPGQVEFEALENLLGQIVSYRRIEPKAPVSQAERLEAKIAEFERRRRNSEFLHRDGDGIGRTLGMNVRRS